MFPITEWTLKSGFKSTSQFEPTVIGLWWTRWIVHPDCLEFKAGQSGWTNSASSLVNTVVISIHWLTNQKWAGQHTVIVRIQVKFRDLFVKGPACQKSTFRHSGNVPISIRRSYQNRNDRRMSLSNSAANPGYPWSKTMDQGWKTRGRKTLFIVVLDSTL